MSGARDMTAVRAGDVAVRVLDIGEGPAVLLVSGVGYGAWYWRGIAPALARGRRVIAFDARGTGPDPPPGPYSSSLLAADAVALLDALGAGRADVVGHSLGGMVAQEMALAHPDRVRRLVLVSTTHGGRHAVPVTPAALDVLTRRDGDPEDLFRRAMEVSTGPGFTRRRPEVVAALWAYRAGTPVGPEAFAAQVAAGAAHDSRARLAGVRCPALVVTGSHDRVVPPRNAALLAALIPGARMVTLPGVGHHVPLEDPDATISLLRGFLPPAGSGASAPR